MKKGCVHQYQSINLSPGEKIKVMQCRYDEMGYYKIEFVEGKLNPEETERGAGGHGSTGR